MIRFMIPLITAGCALAALIISLVNGLGGRGKPPLWIAVALVSFGVMLPWLLSRILF
jgi:hypothetical protein